MKAALCALLAGLVLLAAQWLLVAQAHAELVTAYPAPGATLDATRLEIRLTFSERIGLGSTVRLFGPQFRAVPGVRSGVDPVAPEQLRAIPPKLTPDTYTVEWSAISADGHAVSGSYAFAVSAPARQRPAWLFIAPPLALLMAGGVAWEFLRRRRGGPPVQPDRPGGALL
jgi:methionine-rich copper-binding protein CopC